MAQTTLDKIVVDQLTKFGFKVVGSSDYVNYSKNLAEGDKTKVVPGASLEVEFYIADSGKRYLNKVLGHATASQAQPTVASQASTLVNTPVDTERAKKFTPKFTKKETPDNSMSKADWAQKDRNMMIGGRSHDAAVITAAMLGLQVYNNTDEVLKCYRQVLEGMLAIAEEVK